MKLCVSNIAWNKDENDAALEILKSRGITNIDIAPTLVFDSLESLDIKTIRERYREYIQKSFEIVGMQSLLYGIPNYSLFDGEFEQKQIINHLKKVFIIAKEMHVKELVFGSPKNRFIKLPKQENTKTAINFFRKICDLAQAYEAEICLEANPKEYGCNFITNTREAIKFISEVKRDNLKLNFDTSTVILNQDDFQEILNLSRGCIGHIHISAPFLKDIKNLNHEKIAKALKSIHYEGYVSLEMKSGTTGDNLKNLEENLDIFVKYYKN